MCSKKYNTLRLKIIQKLTWSNASIIFSITDQNKFKIEMRSTLWSMPISFVSILHKNLLNGNSRNFLAGALADLNYDILPDSSVSPTLYYIFGRMLTATEKEYLRRGNTILVTYLDTLVENCMCTDGETARDAGLPTEKVDRLSSGGLKYPSKDFFTLICSMKHVFLLF